MTFAALLDELILVCKKYDVLTIADEVMTGFFKTGTCFAIDHLTNKPDFVCISKALTGGYFPLGVTAFTETIAKVFQSENIRHTFYHGHSFTANPLACRAALASLELIELEYTAEKVQHIFRMHQQAAKDFISHPLITEVRTMGLVLAMDIQTSFQDYFYNNPIRDVLYREFIRRGIIIRPLGNVVYVLPPACITDEQLNRIYAAMHEVLDQLKM